MNTLLNICSHANCFAGYLGLKSAWGNVCGTMTFEHLTVFALNKINLWPWLHFTMKCRNFTKHLHYIQCNMTGRDVFLLIS